jgi:hypothetical protein
LQSTCWAEGNDEISNPENKKPAQWLRLPSVAKTLDSLQESYGNIPQLLTIPGQGTYVCQILAIQYAQYLDERFALAVSKHFQDTLNKDPKQAIRIVMNLSKDDQDEVLQTIKDLKEQQECSRLGVEWKQVREFGKIPRRSLTDAIQTKTTIIAEYYRGEFYSRITNALYEPMFGMKKKDLAAYLGVEDVKDFRECLSKFALETIKEAEEVIAEAFDGVTTEDISLSLLVSIAEEIGNMYKTVVQLKTKTTKKTLKQLLEKEKDIVLVK